MIGTAFLLTAREVGAQEEKQHFILSNPGSDASI